MRTIVLVGMAAFATFTVPGCSGGSQGVDVGAPGGSSIPAKSAPGTVVSGTAGSSATSSLVSGNFCADLRTLKAGPTQDLGTPAVADESKRQLEALRDEGPPEFVDAWNAYAAMLQEVAAMPPNDPANFDKFNQVVANPKYRDATIKIFGYAKQTCGVDLASSPPGSAPGQASGSTSTQPRR